MLFSGLCEQEFRGEIYRRITGAGAIPTVVLFVGVTKYPGEVAGNPD